MKRIWIFLFMFFVLMVSVSYADRNVSTIKSYTSNTLIKTGDWKVYRITFIASASGGFFTIYDSLTLGAVSSTNIKTEGSEAVSSNARNLSFVGKPLEGSTGLYLMVGNATVIVEYE